MNRTEIVPLWRLFGPLPPGEPDVKTDGRNLFTEKRRRILVVDDEPLIADTIADILTGGGFEATASYCGRSALEQARRSCPDAVVSDVIMPQLNGIDMAISIKKTCPKTRILLLSGQRSTADLVEAARKEGHHFELLFKPLRPDILLGKLRQ